MKIKLINKNNTGFNAFEQILLNRGIDSDKIKEYLNLSWDNVCDYMDLGEEPLKKTYETIVELMENDFNAIVVVDSDCDGYCSAALLANYLYKINSKWTKEHLDFFLHKGKFHGLSDCYKEIINSDKNYKCAFCPDSASNDISYSKALNENGIKTIVMDHHLVDVENTEAILINIKSSNYKNKELCGTGTVWQVCRYLDEKFNTNYANNFLDLVALANTSDMMSLMSYETKFLTLEGFKHANIKNPFIDYMVSRNNYSLLKSEYSPSSDEYACTSIGAAFFIVPFVNATTRSGTDEEKELIFNSMLEYKAFELVPEVKRSKETGNMEKLVLKAVRTIAHVKARQTKEEQLGLDILNEKIKDEGLLDHKVLLFLLNGEDVSPNIRGLCANKMMSRYQRPCIIATNDNGVYSGSARGYTKCGLKDFKFFVESMPGVIYAQGHSNAFGLSIQENKIEDFLSEADDVMSRLNVDEPVYYVDYFFKNDYDDAYFKILEISNMNDFWGVDFERSLIAIRFKITPDNFSVMKSNTLKITLDNGISLIKFGGTEDDIKAFSTKCWVEVDAVCKCVRNEWNGEVTPQLIIQDYEVVDDCRYDF